MNKSKFDLFIVISGITFSITLNLSKLIPCIMFLVVPNICKYDLLWSTIHTCIFGCSTLVSILYVLYLLFIPHDVYKYIVVSKVMGVIGIPFIIVDVIIGSMSLPGCIYSIDGLINTAYISGLISSGIGIFYALTTGLYSIYRWRSGL
jgi:hypothetical protein